MANIKRDTDIYLAAGAISGTSMDSIDVAVVRTDGERSVATLAGGSRPYSPQLTLRLRDAVARASHGGDLPPPSLEHDVTEAFVGALYSVLCEAKIDPLTLDVFGLHGQTILHRPERGLTVQLGDGRMAASVIGCCVVDKFRHSDIAAGGQGAPLTPIYHRALIGESRSMILNWGGVGNVTFISDGERNECNEHDARGDDDSYGDGGTFVSGSDLLAFDTGPGCAVLDDFIRLRLGRDFDPGGELAASGCVNWDIVKSVMLEPYFAARPPKSLDRNDFHDILSAVSGLSDADGAATIAAVTIESVALSMDFAPEKPLRCLVCGGGRRNHHLMRLLGERIDVPVAPIDDLGIDGDMLEAQAFAYLAVRALRRLPITFAGTTGVSCPLVGGEIHQPQ